MSIFSNKVLQAIFCIAIFLRLLYFPLDINFGYDQARDAFISQKILKGDFVVVGPPTTFEGLFHGALFYYFFAPFYFLGNGNPIFLSIFLRILNASGVSLVFLIAKNLFPPEERASNKKIGYIASFIFAISFEQTQFANFLAHPSAGVFTSLFFFWGISELIFNKKSWGLVAASFGLGLSFQMHFSMFYLLPCFIILLLIFKNLVILEKRHVLISVLILILLTSTFWLAELKFNFQNTRGATKLLTVQSGEDSSLNFYSPLKVVSLYIRDNFLSFNYEK